MGWHLSPSGDCAREGWDRGCPFSAAHCATPMPSTYQQAVGRNRTTRVSISLPGPVYEHLMRRSDREGRSFSSLCAFLLECATRQVD